METAGITAYICFWRLPDANTPMNDHQGVPGWGDSGGGGGPLWRQRAQLPIFGLGEYPTQTD